MSALTQRFAPHNLSQDWTADIFGETGAPTVGAYASLVVNPAGDRNALKFVARAAGTAGNSITVQYQKQAVADVAIAVQVTGSAILVKVQKTGGGAVVNTAHDVAVAVLASTPAAALVRTEFVDDNGDSDEDVVIVAELGPTNLAGGLTSDADKAWAYLGQIPAGAQAQLSQVRANEAFDLAGVGDHGDVAFYAVQPDALSIAWDVTALGTHLSATDAVGVKAKAVTDWLGTVNPALPTDVYVVLASHDANDLAPVLASANGLLRARVIFLE